MSTISASKIFLLVLVFYALHAEDYTFHVSLYVQQCIQSCLNICVFAYCTKSADVYTLHHHTKQKCFYSSYISLIVVVLLIHTLTCWKNLILFTYNLLSTLATDLYKHLSTRRIYIKLKWNLF